MKSTVSVICTLSILIGLSAWKPAFADPLLPNNPKIKAADKIPMKANAFDLRDVHLTDGPFLRAQKLDEQYLLELDPDRLLHNFRLNAGLPSSAAPLGGWEEPKCEVRGHFVGHYLTACALMYATTGDARFKEKGEVLVRGLAACQAKLGSGYLSAFPEEFFDRVESRKQVWAPYYTLHKIYAGLLDMYVYCDDREALEICKKFADWVIARNEKLSDDQMQAMLSNEHGGMNEVLANLYGLTGEEKYLKIANRFNHHAVIDPAAKGEERLTGLHANTQIPKFIGTARQYELTADDGLKAASLFFWNTVANERSYVIGGHSDGEMFSPKEHLSEALGPSTTETCNTYNMLKLTRHLFCWEPRAEYADYYERALLNHILSSQDPETGMMCYYVPLRSGSHKEYNGKFDGFWCCTGTGVENHAKYGDSIYFQDGDNTLFVNLFIASELNWKAKGVKVRQETKFPDEGSSRLVVTCEKPTALRLCVRHPHWSGGDFAVSVNGEKLADAGKPGSYAIVDRTWKSGDRVEISMPFHLRTEGFRDNPRRFAFLDGPVVLCAAVDPKKPFPVAVAEEGKVTAALEPVPGKPSVFRGSAEVFRMPGEATQNGVVFEPFYKMHGHREYMVYWDLFSADQWKAKAEEYKAKLLREKELEARTVDRVNPGEEQNERDHRQQGERTAAGDFGERKYRHATDGGWFSWEMKVLPGKPQELCVTYWGSDRGNRVFDIFIDGSKLATQKLENNKPDSFYEERYLIPDDMLKGKDRVVVKFQAQPNGWAGGVFGVRMMRVKEAEHAIAVEAGPFQPTMDSLKQYECPDWFRDAKFGIWAHWGPQAVPMDGDWYARGMYEPGNKHYQYHQEHYGHPSKFGYKDIIPLWKAEKWDPDRLMQLYKKAGAKYFVSMGSHHDNFFLWNSKLHKWNAVNMGPKRDVVGDWQKAAQKYGLRFGVSEHLGASFTWFQSSHRADKEGPKAGVPYDGADPQYQDLYHFPAEPDDTGWYSNNPKWQRQWYAEIKELVDNYHPDLLYSDGGVPFGNEVGLSMIAHFYNSNAALHNGKIEAIYNCKQRSEGRWIEDLERGVMPKIDPHPWQTDTSIGDWYYNRDWKFRPVSWVIHMLVDNVSKNGNLLLNVVQRPDGSLDPEVEQMLGQLAEWNAVHGEAIFGTRPWLVYGESAIKMKGGHFQEDFKYNAREIRFTTKGPTLYAIAMGWPEDGQLIIRSLAKPEGENINNITGVSLLGYEGKIDWKQTPEGLFVTLPEKKVSEYTAALRITGTELKNVPIASVTAAIGPDNKGNITLSASDAEIEGNGLAVEEHGGVPNLGFWDDPAAYVTWKVRLPAPGVYRITGSFAAAIGESVLDIECAGRKITVKVPKTKSWDDFQEVDCGSLQIEQVGEVTLTARPKDAASWKAINLRVEAC